MKVPTNNLRPYVANRGFTFVAFVHPKMCTRAFTAANTVHGFVLRGRRLKVWPNPLKPGHGRPTVPSDVFKVTLMQVWPCTQPMLPSNFLLVWGLFPIMCKCSVVGARNKTRTVLLLQVAA